MLRPEKGKRLVRCLPHRHPEAELHAEVWWQVTHRDCVPLASREDAVFSNCHRESPGSKAGTGQQCCREETRNLRIHQHSISVLDAESQGSNVLRDHRHRLVKLLCFTNKPRPRTLKAFTHALTGLCGWVWTQPPNPRALLQAVKLKAGRQPSSTVARLPP